MASRLHQQILRTWGPKLGINSSSQILTTEPTAETIIDWLAEQSIVHPFAPTVTALVSDQGTMDAFTTKPGQDGAWRSVRPVLVEEVKLPFRADSATHVWRKGVAVLTCWDPGSVEAVLERARAAHGVAGDGQGGLGSDVDQEAVLKDRLETAGWERGRVRICG